MLEYRGRRPLPQCEPPEPRGVEPLHGQRRGATSTALAYDTGHRLRFELGGLRGIMPFADCVDAAPGETVKDIAVLTRVGRLTCFVIMGTEFDDNGEGILPALSRAEAQRRCRAQYL